MNSKKISITFLFIALMLFMPSLYMLLFVTGGFLPPIFYLYFFVGGGGSIWLIHLILYSIINFVISFLVIEFYTMKKYGENTCLIFSVAVIVILIMTSFFPIYGISSGHGGSSNGFNIVDIYKNAGKVSPLPWQKNNLYEK